MPKNYCPPRSFATTPDTRLSIEEGKLGYCVDLFVQELGPEQRRIYLQYQRTGGDQPPMKELTRYNESDVPNLQGEQKAIYDLAAKLHRGEKLTTPELGNMKKWLHDAVTAQTR